MTRESSLWRWLRADREAVRDYHVGRVENAVGSGMPDCEGHAPSPIGVRPDGQFWMELKCEPRPARATTLIRPTFQPAQVPWITRRWRLGGNTSVLLQVGEAHRATRYLVPGCFAIDVYRGVLESDLARLDVLGEARRPVDVFKAASRIQALVRERDRR